MLGLAYDVNNVRRAHACPAHLACRWILGNCEAVGKTLPQADLSLLIRLVPIRITLGSATIRPEPPFLTFQNAVSGNPGDVLLLLRIYRRCQIARCWTVAHARQRSPEFAHLVIKRG